MKNGDIRNGYEVLPQKEKKTVLNELSFFR